MTRVSNLTAALLIGLAGALPARAAEPVVFDIAIRGIEAAVLRFTGSDSGGGYSVTGRLDSAGLLGLLWLGPLGALVLVTALMVGLVGITAVLATCVTAGFAGVYFEKMLKDGGIDIARRTVAKYREAMNIASSVQRRREKQALR